tara:strand:- start:74 stop:319 length:246 start_codon:yes stop_codon:yes gene_type:complete
MGRTSGTPNKITTEVRGKLESLIEGLVDSIYIEELTPNQRIKMLQIALQYTLPRLQAMVVKNDTDQEVKQIEVEIINSFEN